MNRSDRYPSQRTCTFVVEGSNCTIAEQAGIFIKQYTYLLYGILNVRKLRLVCYFSVTARATSIWLKHMFANMVSTRSLCELLAATSSICPPVLYTPFSLVHLAIEHLMWPPGHWTDSVPSLVVFTLWVLRYPLRSVLPKRGRNLHQSIRVVVFLLLPRSTGLVVMSPRGVRVDEHCGGALATPSSGCFPVEHNLYLLTAVTPATLNCISCLALSTE